MSADPRAAWPYRIDDADPARVADLRARVEQAAARAQYGWGHTIDFGPFVQPGLLEDRFLEIAGWLDEWGWWPRELAGLRVADIGAFTGGVSLLLAARGPAVVYAVDEVPEHLEQCRLLSEAFDVERVQPVEASLYELPERIEAASLDVVLLSGVLYHLSDMLVGLRICHDLLRPGGTLVVESNAVECFEHSYANFCRYFEGAWWQPTALCLADLAVRAGFERPPVRFYRPGRALARLVRPPAGRAGSAPVAARSAPAPEGHLRRGPAGRAAALGAERAFRSGVAAAYAGVLAARRVRSRR